jgi:anthranilate synthase component 1
MQVTRVLPGQYDLLPLAATNPARFPCLLESTAQTQSNGRYDILFWHQGEVITATPEAAFLDRLDEAWQRIRVASNYCDLPFRGGWVLLLDYELAAECEPALRSSTPSVRPTAVALRAPAAIIVDRVKKCTYLLAEKEHAHCIDEMHDALLNTTYSFSNRSWDEVIEEDDPQFFLNAVARIHAYLRAGDVFQVNLSREWRASCSEPAHAADIYHRLRQSNPAPFAGLFQYAGRDVVSSSPERLVEVRGAMIQTRPIAGTRPRSSDPVMDARLIQELIQNPKERAEHVMMLDLERNDLGRVCRPGSIEVNELMHIESYQHVHHIVSNVRGLLRSEVTPGQVIRAVFPGGTITGCPKVRCMQIIAELEQTPRGVYTGSLGYLNRDGDMDLNILIRTISIEEQLMRWRAGSGIVFDSIASCELEETRSKARGVQRAINSMS